MTGPRDLSPQDTSVTQLIVDGPSPSIGAGFEVPGIPEGDDPMGHWCSALHQILRRWI
jgi:hypothetical protein